MTRFTGQFILNFHGIGDPARPLEAGEDRYWIAPDEFRSVLDLIAAEAPGQRIGITFDDGNASDHAIALPELRKRGLGAVVFPLAAKLDLPGYLTRSQTIELAAEGLEIGSHGLHHVDWTAIPATGLRDEVATSKAILEEVIGKPVCSAGLPFGRYDKRVLDALAQAAYGFVYSSDGGPRLREGWPIPRYSIQRGVDLQRLRAFMLVRKQTVHRAAQEAKIAAKCVRRPLFRG